jgi:glycosyltransferase involved in cell wall biosynthesis
MKIYEYMALGKAAIAPNQETIREIASHGQGIYLFEAENVQSMAAALQTMIEDTALRQQLGQQALQIAATHTWTKRAQTLEEALTKILAQRAG